MSDRSILHVDMDAFYASVEQRDDPSLRGRPLVVGGGLNRGVVAAASYESREFGIRSAMPMAEAIRRCPDLIRIPPNMTKYKAVSKQIFDIFLEFTPMVEGLSLDEAFLDVTQSLQLFHSAENIARRVKETVLTQTELTASVGVAQNKLVAKIASDLEKPNGLCIVMPGDYASRLDPLPVQVIPGIGKQTLRQLLAVNISLVGDLRRAPDKKLRPIFGRYTQRTRERAAGIDDRPVVVAREEKSISAEETYDQDLTDTSKIDAELLHLSERTATRLRKASLDAGTLQIKVRQSDFQTFTRQQSVRPPTSGTEQIYAIAKRLLQTWTSENPSMAIRLLGVGASNLTPSQQADLFETIDASQQTAVDSTVDEIREKFGSAALGRARTLDRR